MKKLICNKENIQEGLNICHEIYSPLKGFLRENDLHSVLKNMRLSNGEIWSMPIILSISKKTANKLAGEKNIVITDKSEQNIFLLKDIEIYPFDKTLFKKKLFGTLDVNHPGIKRTEKMKSFLIGGDLELIKENLQKKSYDFYPEKTKEIFKKNGWAKIAAFQTRNPPHRSHEHLQKTALKQTDGLFINPIIGKKKSGDFKDKHIMKSYEILIKNYYPENKVVLGTLKTFMRYAGPKEAIFHALIRKNFGCTHMIIGRDHAGVGNYYKSYEAQNIFDKFEKDELGIKILKYENAFFCKGCQKMVYEGQCSHSEKQKIDFSGTKLREKITKKEHLPEEFMRKEVAKYLTENRKNLFVK